MSFFKKFVADFKDVLKHPKKLIPTFVLMGIWLIFSLMSALGVNIPAMRFLYGLTYSNGGMYGGFFGALGGIFGKAVFAAAVNAAVLAVSEKKKLFSTSGLKGIFKASAAGGLSAAAPFVTAGGIGILVYWFFNITASVQNCVIGLVGAVSAVSAAGRQNGILFNLGFGIAGKLSKGRAPSRTSVSRALTGFSMGFAMGFGLTFIRSSVVLAVAGVVLTAAGIAASVVGGKGKKAVATALIALFMVPAIAAGSCCDAYAASWCSTGECSGLSSMLSSGTKGAVGSASSVADCVNAVRLEFGKVTSPFLDNFLDSEMYGCPVNSSKISTNNLSSVDVVRGGSRSELTTNGFVSCYTNGPKGEMIDYSEYMYNVSYNVDVEFTNIAFGKNKVSATANGTETLVYGLTNPDKTYKNGEVTNKVGGEAIDGTWYIDEGKLYVLFDIPGESGNLYMYLEVSRVLPSDDSEQSMAADTDTDTEDYTTSIYGDEEDYVPYKGRLTYNNGRKNKYGQPFPDLMDFDMDGDIDFGDLAIQHELVHNPDYLDLPQSMATKVAVAVLSAILGSMVGAILGGAASAGAAVGGAVAGAAAGTVTETVAEAAGNAALSGAGDTNFGDLGRYISRDEDGDLNVTDPATGEKRLYKANGDGTYTNPLTGATYTDNELAEQVGSRLENAGLISQDQAVADAAISAQRAENQKLSQAAGEYAKQKAEDEEKLKKELYQDKLEIKYGTVEGDTDALKAAIGKKQEQNEENAKYYEDRADMFDKAIAGAEVVQTAADVGVDVLATMTGPAGQTIKKTYTVGKNMATRLSEAVNSNDPNKQSISGAIAMAGFDSLADLTQDALGGKGWQISSNVGSEVFKNGMQNLYDGKEFFEGAGQSALQGTAKGIIDKIGGALTDNQKNITKEALRKDMAQIGHAVANGKISKAGERALRDMRLITYINNLHAEQAVETITTATGDLAKLATDEIFGD